MNDLSRRTFGKQALGSLAVYSLLETLCTHDLFADEVKPITRKWLSDVNELSRQVRDQELRQVEWQQKVEELFAMVDLPDLLRLIDFDNLTKNVNMADNGARSLRLRFPKVEGLPREYVFGKQVFALKKGRSVVPHGHNNMATAFLVLKGNLRGRHYDRLEDLDQHLIIKPTIDRAFRPGDHSSVSEYKDNVHWFQALSEPAYIFNIHVFQVSPATGYRTGRVYVNPNGEKLNGGRIRAPKLGYKECHRLFG